MGTIRRDAPRMNEPIHFREGSLADRDAILTLRAAAFGSDDPEKRQPAFWDWEFRRGYAGEALLFVAESRAQLVGHIAFIPQDYATPAGLARGVLAVDAMVHPQFHRQGVFRGLTRFAAQRLRDRFALSLALQIRKASLAGMLAGGWQVAGTLPVRLRPLSRTALVRDLGVPIRTRNRDRDRASHPNIRPLTLAELPQLDAMTRGDDRQPRTAAFLTWRYLENSARTYDIDGWLDGDVVRAFVVHRPAVLKGMQTRAIVDAGAQQGAESCLQTLIAHVCTHAGDASLGAALLSDHHPATPILRRCRFLSGPHRFNLLVQVFDDRFRAAATAPWSLSWGDTDHL
jgi:GNAT superfamily N-acetyltransferase